MTQAIMNAFSCAVSLIACCVIYVFTIAKPLSYFLLTPTYRKHTPTDKGIGKYKFPEGRGVVCEPDTAYKKHLKKYVIFAYNKRKYMKCKLSDDVFSIRYEVAVYNSENRQIKILDLAENIEIKGETRTVRLPNNTAYVSVILKTVNEEESFSTLRTFPFAKICVFSILTIGMTIGCGLLARATVLSVSTLLNLNWSIALGANLVASSIIGVLVVLSYLMVRKKHFFGKKL